MQGVEKECLDTLMLITFFNILHCTQKKKKGKISKGENIKNKEKEKRDKGRGNFSTRLSTPI